MTTIALIPGEAAGQDTNAAMALQANTVPDLAWFDLLADPALRELVDSALFANRDMRIAVARIDEFRGLAGVAKSELFPSSS